MLTAMYSRLWAICQLSWAILQLSWGIWQLSGSFLRSPKGDSVFRLECQDQGNDTRLPAIYLLYRAHNSRNKFECDRERRYIDEAIALAREALPRCGNFALDTRMSCLAQLSMYLTARYEQFGKMEDIDEAVNLGRKALALCPQSHSERSVCLTNLSRDLCTRFNRIGSADDLDEAIVLSREDVVLCPPNHPGRSIAMNNLATHLHTRHQHLGVEQDLDEAIIFCKETLALRPPGHLDRPISLLNLASHLMSKQAFVAGGKNGLDEILFFDREALALSPPGHPLRSKSLANLASHLATRSKALCGSADLDEAITLEAEALALRPAGHPDRPASLNNLAVYITIRYENVGAMEYINKVIALDQEALSLRPPGHPDRSRSLKNLTARLFIRYQKFGHPQDLEEIFRLYADLTRGLQTVSLKDLSTAKEWIKAAEVIHHPQTLLAYETALQLLTQHVVALPTLPQHLPVLKALASSLAVDAFSACLRTQSPTKAVELLEQGRGVFWNQLVRIRSQIDDVSALGPTGKALATDFIRLTSLIRNALDSPSADRHDRVCHLNLELQKAVSNIRTLPGHSRFLLPLLFTDLRCAASHGPVIVVNASSYSCDALVVFFDTDPVHIPLSVAKQDVRALSSKLHALIRTAKQKSVTKDLREFLRELWDKVVFPIFKTLRSKCPPESRIWWCPTAEFSLLPLHAANPYREGQQGLSSLYTSSYIPSLSALIRARQHYIPNPSTEQKRFLIVGVAEAAGADKLLSVSAELASIAQCVDGLATCTHIEGEASCISKVVEELGKSQWLHLACHGIPKKKRPFDSAFVLHDGRLTVHHIAQCDLRQSEYAYLSACHTTVGDEESPDEAIHLAAAMQFAGFRSVIGTMWIVDDAAVHKITSEFYKHMVDDSGRLDHTRAACALRKTMKSVKNVPLDQRILYIHLGV